MADRNLEMDLLLEQRNTLISDIKELNSDIIKIIIALIPVIVTLILSFFSQKVSVNDTIVRYIVLEVVLILSMVIVACLLCANIKRDYIAAIDTYIFEKYGVSILICNGELSRKHTTGIKGAFPLMTLLIGVSSASVMLFLMYNIVKNDIDFYKNHRAIVFVSSVQVLLYIIVIIINVKRKIFQKSIITEDCLNHMNRNKENADVRVVCQDICDSVDN